LLKKTKKNLKKSSNNLYFLKARIKINERVHVIDEATRNRRQRKALDALEKDNFQDELPQSRALPDFKVQLNKKLQQRFSLINDPDANEVNEEVSAGNTPLNSSSTDGQEISRKRKLKPESKLRHRKNYTNLLEEEVERIFINLIY